ncbi:MAG: TldD/PmbA family protein, partial [Methylocystaceae bacterium]
MLEQKLLAQVLDEVLTRGGEFAEIYVEKKASLNIVAEDNKIEKINRGEEAGVGIRVVNGGNTAYAYTNDLSYEGMSKAAQVASHAAANGGRQKEIQLDKPVRVPLEGIEKMPSQVSFEQKVSLVKEANDTARSLSDEVKQVTVALGESLREVQIANSLGQDLEQEILRTRFVINVVASRDGQIQTGYDAMGGTIGWEILDQTRPADLATTAGKRALLMLDAKPAPTGKMPVVMSSEAGGTMVHEACGHGLEADLVQKGLSVYRGKEGQMVAASQVTVMDDATIAHRYGTLVYDDEAVKGRRNVLIDKGELKGYMYDRITAGKAGVESTGNGRRESYQNKPIPRMTNTLIAPGEDDPEKIVRDTKKGLFVRKMGGGQVNTTNGDYVFEVTEGYMIENGELKYPVRGATLAGSGPQTLMNIDRVGKDLGFSLGTCGKDGQGVPVADAQPTIRIKELVVGGTAVGDEDSAPTIKR